MTTQQVMMMRVTVRIKIEARKKLLIEQLKREHAFQELLKSSFGHIN